MTTKPTLYLDMDGVLADFNAAARELLNANKSQEERAAQSGRWPDHEWRKIADHPNFYRILPKMPLADELVDLAIRFRENLDYDVKILTAIPSGNDMHEVFQDKFDWMAEHYGKYNIRMHFGPYSKDKFRHCQGRDDILVDDRTSNCTEWRAAGGTAIQVKPGEYRQALIELETIFHELMTLRMI